MFDLHKSVWPEGVPHHLDLPEQSVAQNLIDSCERSPEIVISAPQLFQGYWNNEKATKAAFIEVDGKPFFRTGDIAYYDENGYFFMFDRLKRMINVSGFKMWPAEVETLMYSHPDIADVCIIGVANSRRGESVKAIIVPLPKAKESLTEERIISWCRERMSVYKCPAEVSFVEKLPKSGSGKVLWRLLTEQEKKTGVNRVWAICRMAKT